MAEKNEKKTYTRALIEVMSELGELKAGISEVKTISGYQENHLGNIDKHLNKLNERVGISEVQTAVNKSGISRIYKIGGGIFLGLLTIIGIIVAIAFGVLNLFP